MNQLAKCLGQASFSSKVINKLYCDIGNGRHIHKVTTRNTFSVTWYICHIAEFTMTDMSQLLAYL